MKPILPSIALASLVVLAACTGRQQATSTSAPADATPPSQEASVAKVPPAMPAKVAATNLPRMIVHKSPTCGCCGLWVDHMRAAGFTVEVRNQDDSNPVWDRVGVPLGKGSCHTAEVGGYFIEGHVPAEDVKRLLAEKPAAKGLVLPGMPLGSPGMEVPGGAVQPYTVELVDQNGATTAFARH